MSESVAPVFECELHVVAWIAGAGSSEQLTGRQREVLQMLAEGRSMKEIAYVLEIAHRTVRFHKYRIMEELGITTNSDLVKYAIRHGMISVA
jgi:DNA-binding CsgD family transcriptional regulator